MKLRSLRRRRRRRARRLRPERRAIGHGFCRGRWRRELAHGLGPDARPRRWDRREPPFSPTQTVGERSHLEIFDKLDFDVFSHHDWERRAKAMPRTFAFTSPTLTTPMASTSTPPTWLLGLSAPDVRIECPPSASS